MADHKQAVSDVAAALKQVLSVSPQLLYEASARLGSELMIETMRVECTPGETVKHADRLKFRVALCMLLSRTLIQSGRASITADDVAAMQAVASLRSAARAAAERTTP